MPVLSLGMLKEGLVLARDVVRRDGTVLAPAGTVLDMNHCINFAEEGYVSIEVTAESIHACEQLAPAENPALSADAIAVRLQQLAKLFAEHKSDPLMREICRLAIKCVKEGLIGV